MPGTFSTSVEKEKAVLVGVDFKSKDDVWPIKSSMDELASLTVAAGARVIHKIIQKLDTPSATHYLGKGKLQELIDLQTSKPYSLVILNDELSPRQQRNLEDLLKVKVIDRTALILDIFGRRAQTSEGKLQVELAQLQYILPRLAGQWSHLERMGAGIGTRGPGESQLETDRRLIRQRIKKLESKIEAVRRHRELYRQRRKKQGIPVVALVGYTNAGKSTLLNSLGSAGVHTENKPFSTLDPVTRHIELGEKTKFLITDTVGFIHKLPPSIVAAFRATLEELQESDIMVHVVDITHPDVVKQYLTVEEILDELQLHGKKKIIVLNKIDIAANDIHDFTGITNKLNIPKSSEIVHISALKGWGLDELLNMISRSLGLINQVSS
jgi:GTP-binding protein HflX